MPIVLINVALIVTINVTLNKPLIGTAINGVFVERSEFGYMAVTLEPFREPGRSSGETHNLYDISYIIQAS